MQLQLVVILDQSKAVEREAELLEVQQRIQAELAVHAKEVHRLQEELSYVEWRLAKHRKEHSAHAAAASRATNVAMAPPSPAESESSGPALKVKPVAKSGWKKPEPAELALAKCPGCDFCEYDSIPGVGEDLHFEGFCCRR